MLNSTNIHLGQESFEICQDDDDESSIYGTIHGISGGKIHLIGQEKVGNELRILIDQEYPFFASSKEGVIPFDFSIPSHLPPSIQLQNGDGISYSLEVVNENGQVATTQPVHLHMNTMGDHDDKVFWGILQQQWQYEIEFPSVYYFNQQQEDNTSQVCIRFKSLEGQQQKKLSDCCLIGFQIIQSIQRKGYETEYQVISMETKLLTELNQTWNDPYLLVFNLLSNDETRLLPTTWTENIVIQHDIKFTLAFTDPLNNLNFDFSVTCIEDFASSNDSVASSNSSIITSLVDNTPIFQKQQNSTVFVNNVIV